MIRKEQSADITRIREINIQAFDQSEEADLVDRLRERCKDILELVAVCDNEVIGHILFSPATIEYQGRTIAGAALGLMAVMPRYQRRGIGTKLVKDGVLRLQEKSCPFLVVIGHPEYYPRFGFRPASQYGIQSDWDVPDEAFMMIVLADEEMQGVKGTVKYRPEFSQA